jgi:hypothetical protein
MRDSTYNSPFSVGQRKPIYIDVNDPRISKDKYGNYVSKIGVPVIVVNQFGATVASLAANLQGVLNPTTTSSLSSADIANAVKSDTSSTTLLITNLTAAWSGHDIALTFTFDLNDLQNKYIAYFLVEVYDPSVGSYFSMGEYSTADFLTNGSTQTLVLKSSDLAVTGIKNRSLISKVRIKPLNILSATPGWTEANVTGSYTVGFNSPIITVTNGTSSYTVVATNFATESVKDSFYNEIIEEYITTETNVANIPSNAQWTAVGSSVTGTYTVFAADGLHRWVRAAYYAQDGGKTDYSNLVEATPQSLIPTNTNPPTIFTAASGSFSDSGSGNNIVISYTMPSSNKGVIVKVKLIPTSNPSLYAYYYHTIAADTSFTISAADIFAQFSNYYSSFSGVVSALSQAGVESTSTISLAPFSRTSTLNTITPVVGTPNINNADGVFRVTAITNGYTVDWSQPPGATYAEVYESKLPWKAGGGTGFTAYPPADDTNTSYAGLSPAVIPALDNDKRYILIRYYDQYDNYSQYNSITATGQVGGVAVTPVDIGKISLIDNPIKISTNGSIFSGAGDSTVYPQVYFNKDGLFAYDASGNWTTEIVNNASANGNTFVTKRALIADWQITPTAIESILIPNVITKYTGMSASNSNYSFWAGATTSQNSSNDAPFWVTPTGQVHATNVYITGNGNPSSYLITAGGSSNFSVTQSGQLTAQSATIYGSLNVNQASNFNSNINIGNDGILGAYATGATQTSGQSVQMNHSGIVAYDTSHYPTTQISANSIFIGDGSSTLNLGKTSDGKDITFYTVGAVLGKAGAGLQPWTIGDNTITSENITLDSFNQNIVIKSTANSSWQIALDSKSSTKAFRIGDSISPDFYIDPSGKMTATGATITSAGYRTNGSYIKLDGSIDSIIVYGLATNHPGATQTFTAQVTGGAIQGAYSGNTVDVTTKTTTTFNSGNIDTDGFLSVAATKGFQVFNRSAGANSAPMLSIDPTGAYTTFQEFRDGVNNVNNFPSFVVNTDISFLNSRSVILGSGYGLSNGSATESSGYVYINGYARVRNASPVGYGTLGYVRNTYVSDRAPSQSANSGFVGDLWVSTT